MKRVGIKAQVGYWSPRARKGEASIMSPNRLQRQFNPDERWVTDITYIRTHEGWLYGGVILKHRCWFIRIRAVSTQAMSDSRS